MHNQNPHFLSSEGDQWRKITLQSDIITFIIHCMYFYRKKSSYQIPDLLLRLGTLNSLPCLLKNYQSFFYLLKNLNKCILLPIDLSENLWVNQL